MTLGGVEVAVEFVAGEIVEFFQDEGPGFLIDKLAADLGEKGVGPGEAGFERGLVFLEGVADLCFRLGAGHRQECLCHVLSRVERGELVLDLLEELLVLGLEVIGAEAFELELEFQFIAQGFEGGLAFPDGVLQRGDGLLLGLQDFQLRSGGFAGAVHKVVDEGLEGFLDDCSGDVFALLGFVGGDFLGGFHGLGEIALSFADLGLQGLDGISLGLEERGDEGVVGDESVVPAGGDDGLKVVADLLPPVDKDAGTLELVEHAEGDKAVLQAREEFLPDLRHFPALAELGEVITGNLPPILKGLAVAGKGRLQGRIGFQSRLDGGFACDGSLESEVAGSFRQEQGVRCDAELAEGALPRYILRFGDAADEVGLHVLGFGLGGVVDVAADVEVVIMLLHDLGLAHEAAVFRQLAFVGKDEINLFDVLGAEFVLVLALGVFAVGVDEENLVTQGVGFILVEDKDAGGDAGAVEEPGRQAHYCLDDVVLDEELADELFLAAAEEDAVGHNGGGVAAGLKAGEHVLDEHEVGLFPGLGAPLAKAGGKLERGAAVVLREGRIGQHAVELADGVAVQNLRVLQGVAVLDGEAGDVVEDHVHHADRPYGAVGVLAEKGKVVRVLALLLNVLVALNEKASGAHGGVVDLVPGPGFDDLHEQADDFAGGVELATLLARAVGEEFYQVFVGRAEEVGKLEVVIHQHEAGPAKVIEQVLPLLVGDLGLPLDGIEIDVVFQHAGEGIVLILHGSDGLVEHVADVVLEILECGNLVAVFIGPGLMPAGADGHEEGLAVGGLVFEEFGEQFRLIGEVGVILPDGRAFAVEFIGQALEEKHAEDELLELGGVHLPAQDVGGLEEEGLELGESDFFGFQGSGQGSSGMSSGCENGQFGNLEEGGDIPENEHREKVSNLGRLFGMFKRFQGYFQDERDDLRNSAPSPLLSVRLVGILCELKKPWRGECRGHVWSKASELTDSWRRTMIVGKWQRHFRLPSN